MTPYRIPAMHGGVEMVFIIGFSRLSAGSGQIRAIVVDSYGSLADVGLKDLTVLPWSDDDEALQRFVPPADDGQET